MKILVFGFSVTAEGAGYVDRCAAQLPDDEIIKVAVGGLQPDQARHLMPALFKQHRPDALIFEEATAIYRRRAPEQRWIDDHTAAIAHLFHLCRLYGARIGILDLPLAEVEADKDWLLQVHQEMAGKHNVPHIALELDEDLVHDIVHPNENGKDVYAAALRDLIEQVRTSPPDFSTLRASRGFDSFSVDDIEVVGGEYREFSRTGLTVKLLNLPENQVFHITLPKTANMVGVMMMMGPTTGALQLDLGPWRATLHPYDRHCYYERLNGKPLTPVETRSFTIMQDDAIPPDELLKGEKNLGPRMGGLAYVLHETQIGDEDDGEIDSHATWTRPQSEDKPGQNRMNAMTDTDDVSPFEVIAIDDVKVAIDRDIVSETIIAVMKRRQYEHVEARLGSWLFDTEEIQPGQRILEVGAGLGFVGSALAQSGKVEKIVSYEANPQLIPLIQETHRLNGVNSEVRNFLLGEESEGVGSIFVPNDFWAASSSGAGEERQAPKASLKAAVNEVQPTFMLIDIEGGETTLFDGVSELPSVHSILIELHQRVIGRAGIAKFFETMHALGFGYDQRYSHGKVVMFQKLDHPMTN